MKYIYIPNRPGVLCGIWLFTVRCIVQGTGLATVSFVYGDRRYAATSGPSSLPAQIAML